MFGRGASGVLTRLLSIPILRLCRASRSMDLTGCSKTSTEVLERWCEVSSRMSLRVELRNWVRDFSLNSWISSPLVPDIVRTALLRLFGLRIGRSRISARCFFGSWNVRIGSHCFVGNGVFFDSAREIVLEDNVQIGPNVLLITSSHVIGGSGRRAAHPANLPILLEKGVWIGAGATILPGVTIHQGVVVGAGAVVTKDCVANSIYTGVPARRLRNLD